jgi:sugar phosphate isomerase/epimerase
MKDYMVTNESKPTFAEIGNGNLDWKNIVPAAAASGCKWYIVEQDTCAGDPFDSLKMSFDYIKANLTG